MKTTYDVIVIGCGPAGLMALRAANDCDVLGLDAKAEIGLPLRCGEGTRKKELEEIFGAEISSAPWIQNEVWGHRVVLENLSRTLKVPYYEIDRPAFERWLAEPVLDRIHLQETCLDIRIGPQEATIRTNKAEYRCKLVILAYGPHFKFQQQFGLMAGRPKDILVCYGGIFENLRIEENLFYYYALRDTPGSLWVFPKSETCANVGFGTLGGFSQRPRIEDLMQAIPALSSAVKLKDLAGAVPVSGAIPRTYGNRLIVCGTAAGFVYGGTGEGIIYALKSGKMAGETALEALRTDCFDERLLGAYEKNWRGDFGSQLEAGVVFIDFLKFAYKFNILEAALKRPSHSNEELKRMIIDGQLPARVRLGYKLAKFLGAIGDGATSSRMGYLYVLINKLLRLVGNLKYRREQAAQVPPR